MNKIFGYSATINGTQMAFAISKTGQLLAQVVSAPEQAAFNLGMAQGSTLNHDTYNNYYRGEEWVAEFIESSQIEGHLGLQRAFKKESKKQDDRFEAARQKISNKTLSQQERRKQRFGVPVVDVESE